MAIAGIEGVVIRNRVVCPIEIIAYEVVSARKFATIAETAAKRSTGIIYAGVDDTDLDAFTPVACCLNTIRLNLPVGRQDLGWRGGSGRRGLRGNGLGSAGLLLSRASASDAGVYRRGG